MIKSHFLNKNGGVIVNLLLSLEGEESRWLFSTLFGCF